MAVLRASDREAVARQLGREPTTRFEVVARCVEPGGSWTHPLVIRNHPIDPVGRPFPTLFWLTCPDAVRAVSRLESAGEIGRMNERWDADPQWREAVERAHDAYARERGRFLPEAHEWAGVGGTRAGVKCLHAHYAHHLAGGDDVVGRQVARDVEPIHPDEPRDGRVAAVDLGTNSLRLLVAQPGPDRELVEVSRDMVITRLGQGVDETGRISDEALQRNLDVLGQYGRRAAALGASRVRVGATSAMRDASNRDEVLEAVRRASGAQAAILTGEQEARLTFLGAVRGLDKPPPFLVMDIGGGSTEFVLGREEPRASISTRMGSVRITERVDPADPPTEEDVERIDREIDTRLEEVEDAVPVGDARTFVAVAGTATTVQAVALDLEAYEPDRIHRTVITSDDAERTVERLSSMTTEERAALPVMAAGRADVIVAGASILVRAMRRFGFHEAVISETDILDGLAIEMVEHTMMPPGQGT